MFSYVQQGTYHSIPGHSLVITDHDLPVNLTAIKTCVDKTYTGTQTRAQATDTYTLCCLCVYGFVDV